MKRKAASRPAPKRGQERRQVPGDLRRLFWDLPGKPLSLDGDRDLLVRRVAGEGGLREMRLLRLSARRADAWVRTARASTWAGRSSL